MRSSIRLTLILVVLGLSIALPGTVHAQQLPNIFINYSLIGNTSTVSTPFYTIVYNATQGGIVSATLSNDIGDTYDLVKNSSIPLLAISVDGKILRNGSLEDVAWSEDRALLLRATYEYDNATVTVYLRIYSWQPLIEVYVNTSRPLNLTVTLLGEERLANMKVGATYAFIANESFNVSLIAEPGSRSIPSSETALSVAITGTSNKTVTIGNQTYNKTYLAFYIGAALVYPSPVQLSYARGELPGNITLHIVNITYSEAQLVMMRLLPSNYLPSVIADPPQALAASGVVNITRDAQILAGLQSYIRHLSDTINQSKNAIENLTKRLENITKERDYYKGQCDHYQQELTARDHQIKALQSRLQRTGLIEIAAFIVGIILGIAGGRYIFLGK